MSERPQASAILRPVAHGAGERDLVAARVDERRAGRAVAGHELEHPLGEPGVGEQARERLAHERRDLARLQHHGVAGHERLHGRVHAQHEREVPGGDDPDDAHRPPREHELLRLQQVEALLAVAQELARALGVEGERVAAREHLGRQRLHAGLAGVAADGLRDLVRALDQEVARAQEEAAPLLEAERCPRRLGRARLLDRAPHVVLCGHLDLTQWLQGRRTEHAELAASVQLSRSVDGTEQRHLFVSPPTLPSSFVEDRPGRVNRALLTPRRGV